jgi:hypothetical protein
MKCSSVQGGVLEPVATCRPGPYLGGVASSPSYSPPFLTPLFWFGGVSSTPRFARRGRGRPLLNVKPLLIARRHRRARGLLCHALRRRSRFSLPPHLRSLRFLSSTIDAIPTRCWRTRNFPTSRTEVIAPAPNISRNPEASTRCSSAVGPLTAVAAKRAHPVLVCARTPPCGLPCELELLEPPPAPQRGVPITSPHLPGRDTHFRNAREKKQSTLCFMQKDIQQPDMFWRTHHIKPTQNRCR